MATLHSVVLAGGLMFFAPASIAQSEPATHSQEVQQSSRLNANERKVFLDKAQKAYSVLSAQGLHGFRCRVQPDFDVAFRTLGTDAVGESQLLPILRKVRFQVVAGADGAATVSHQSDEAPPNQQVGARVTQSIGGMDQVIDGFLQTWAPFAITSPFAGSDAAHVEIEDIGTKYRLTVKDASIDLVMMIRRDFVIEQFDVAVSGKNVMLRPEWDATPKGWRLASYEGTYGSGPGQSQQLSAKFEYQDVEGFQLLRSVDVTVQLPAGTVHVPIAFSEYQVKKF